MESPMTYPNPDQQRDSDASAIMPVRMKKPHLAAYTKACRQVGSTRAEITRELIRSWMAKQERKIRT